MEAAGGLVCETTESVRPVLVVGRSAALGSVLDSVLGSVAVEFDGGDADDVDDDDSAVAVLPAAAVPPAAGAGGVSVAGGPGEFGGSVIGVDVGHWVATRTVDELVSVALQQALAVGAAVERMKMMWCQAVESQAVESFGRVACGAAVRMTMMSSGAWGKGKHQGWVETFAVTAAVAAAAAVAGFRQVARPTIEAMMPSVVTAGATTGFAGTCGGLRSCTD